MPYPESEECPADVETSSTTSSVKSFSLSQAASAQKVSRDSSVAMDTLHDDSIVGRKIRDDILSSCDSSGCSREISPTSFYGNSVVTETMLAEEQKLGMEEKDGNESEMKMVEEISNMEHSQRYARLQHLLEKSSIYSKLLCSKLENQLEKNKQAAAKKRGKKRKAPPPPPAGTGSDETIASEGRSTRSCTRKRKQSEASYQLSDYIDSSGKLKKPKLMESTEDKATKEQLTQDDIDTEERTYNGQLIPPSQPKLVTGGILRQYQLEGVEWLKVLYENGINGILADEMGLGKTIQCIAFISHLIEMEVKGPFLIAAPLSTVSNWVAEFKKFTPTIPVYLYHGSIPERQALRKKIFPRSKKKSSIPSGMLPVVVTSYEICLKDYMQLADRSWKFLIVDEGHRIKNLNCKLIKTLKMYDSANRLLLTGTPLQNNLSELWSLLNFLIPDVFDDVNSFQSWFDFSSVVDEQNEHIIAREKEEHVLNTLHQILTPFLLRRLKTDVELNIPPKKEILVYAPLTELQEKYYTSILDKSIIDMIGKNITTTTTTTNCYDNVLGESNIRTCRAVKYKTRIPCLSDDQFEAMLRGEIDPQSLVKENKDTNTNSSSTVNAKSILNVKMQCVWVMLRKCCNHPYLIEFPLNENGELKIDKDLISASGKLLMLNRMLPVLLERGHKVLIFSQMTQLLDILADYMDIVGLKFARLDGSMSYTDRESEMSTFCNSSDCNVFLLSTRAGGLGINLTAADTVIIFDSDWNPQADLQAQDRCHRIGQTKPVVVYRFVTANTIDQRIVERACSKRKLEKMVIHKEKFKGNRASNALSIEELTDLLRSVDHDKVVKTNDIISDEALEALLERDFAVNPVNDSVNDTVHNKVFKIVKEDVQNDVLCIKDVVSP